MKIEAEREAQRIRKKRHCAKKYAAAKEVVCACGCGQRLKEVDRHARVRRYVSGHNGRKYSDPTQYKREWNHRNRGARAEAKARRFRRLKVKLLNLFGGRCVEKGCETAYTGKNAAMFHFHHRDSMTKEFALGNQLCNKAWDKIVAEAEKCDLLCANHHEMRHSVEF